MKRFGSGIFVFVLLLGGCASMADRLQPRAASGQEVVSRTGEDPKKPIVGVISTLDNSVLSLERTPSELTYGIGFTVVAFNTSPGDLSFGASQISAEQDGKPLTILDENGIRDAERAERKKMMMIAAFAGALSSAAAGYNAGRYANSSLAQQQLAQVNAQNASNFRMVEQHGRVSRDNAERFSAEYSKVRLADNVISPLQSNGGFFLVTDYTGVAPIKFRISVGADSHIVEFSPN